MNAPVAAMLVVLTLVSGIAGAQTLTLPDGLAASAEGAALSALSLDGVALKGVSVRMAVLDPASGEPTQGIDLDAAWTVENGALALRGELRAQGREDRVADLVVEVRGAELNLASMATNPLLQPAKLLSKLPLVSLRIGGEDLLALAVPPDAQCIFEFSPAQGAVRLRYRFGFTQDAREELRMRAPFACVLYRTDPRWHFRSALAGYYRLFPEPFEPFIREAGGWFFANEPRNIPDPQHYKYFEGGPWGLADAAQRGLGTYPYQESSSWTVSLPGSDLPKSYAEAMERFEALAEQENPKGWSPHATCELDTTVFRSGAMSLLAGTGEGGAGAGAKQSVFLEKPSADPILVRGFSRAEGITGVRNNDYSIYVDVCYESGDYLFGQCATFSPGTHDWEQSELVIQPKQPVAELRVYCLVRNRTGKAWFDDLHVGPAGDPAVNWLVNGGFEETEKLPNLQHVRDFVCVNSRGENVVAITDNLSADVGPATPMNLLRFTLNVDPDLPTDETRRSVAARQYAYYDEAFRSHPALAGAYIDSVSAWCYGVLNCRRDHFAANDAPFTYAPGNFRVGAPGRFAMTEFLGSLQDRYHPMGKAIFTNIHVNLDAFPLYLVSDVPGIESSRFQDQDSTFFYRAASLKKPLLLMNFINLHGLDRREVVESFYQNAAQFGELPSTGRFVQEGYKMYGDLAHAWMPAICELASAGWEPIPLATGAQVERFPAEDAVYFTLRAPVTPEACELSIEPAALAGLGLDLVAVDALTLAEVPLVREGEGARIALHHGAERVTVLRVGPRAGIAGWLLGRAREHALDAARVRGNASRTPELAAAAEILGQEPGTSQRQLLEHCGACRTALDAALKSIQGAEDDLFALSARREVLQAQQAIAALVALMAKLDVSFPGERVGIPGDRLAASPRVSCAAPFLARAVSVTAKPGPALVPNLKPDATVGEASAEVSLPQTGIAHVSATVEIIGPGQDPWYVERTCEYHFVAPASVELQPAEGTREERRYRVAIRRVRPVADLQLAAAVSPDGSPEPERQAVAPDATEALIIVPTPQDGKVRTLRVSLESSAGAKYAQAETSFWAEPSLAGGNLALAATGAQVTADSSYDGYSPDVLIDGAIDVEGMHWTRQAWASADRGEPHWIEIRFPQARQVGSVQIYWSVDGGRPWTSRQLRIVGLTDAEPVTLAEVSQEGDHSFTEHAFAPTEVKGLRIEQAAGDGPAARRNIMWVREVAAFAPQ